MASKSKSKGNAGERELCGYCSGLFGGSFTRVPNSGAFTGGKNAWRKTTLSETQNRLTRGDIIAPDFMPKLVIEAKSYADFRFHQLLEPGPMPQLDAWIEQSLDTVDDGDLWMVCFKITRIGWFVAVRTDLAEGFSIGNHALYTGAFGTFYVTALKTMFEANRDQILLRSASPDEK
jgi:hypothetical protein